jgi:hypothetical protein
MTDFVFIAMLFLIPIAGMALGVLWLLYKLIAETVRNIKLWWYFRRHKTEFQSKIEPKF